MLDEIPLSLSIISEIHIALYWTLYVELNVSYSSLNTNKSNSLIRYTDWVLRYAIPIEIICQESNFKGKGELDTLFPIKYSRGDISESYNSFIRNFALHNNIKQFWLSRTHRQLDKNVTVSDLTRI